MTLLAFGSLLEVLGVKDTGQVPGLDTLEGQGGDERCADTAAVLGSQDLDRVLLLGVLLLGPVEDLAEGLRAARLEVRVFVKDRPVGADVAGGVVLLLADGRDAAGGQAGGAGADQLGEAADELELGAGADDIELLGEGVVGLLEVLKGIPADVSINDDGGPLLAYSSIADRKDESRLYALRSREMSWFSKMLTSLLSCRSTRTSRKISPR